MMNNPVFFCSRRALLTATLAALLSGAGAAVFPVHGEEKLNMAFVQGGASLEAFTPAAGLPAGRYLVDVELNGTRKGRRILDVTEADADGLCLSPAWLAQAGIYLREEVFAPAKDAVRGCWVLDRLPATGAAFDFTTQVLALSVPQKGLQVRPQVTTREYGTSALRMNYSVNGTHNRGGSMVSGVAGLKANVGRWVMDGSASFTEGGQDISVASASRALEVLDADLTVGQTSAGDNILGSSGMRGVTLRSNNSMRPDWLGYNPVFSGVALTPSRVMLLQGGRMVHSELVPAGPFELREVSLLNSGDVTMVITDDQGRETRERIPLTRLSGQLTPGVSEYSLALGELSSGGGSQALRGGVASLSYGQGFRGVTARGSVMGHTRYTGGGGELVTGLGDIGSLAVTGSVSRMRYAQGPAEQGQRVSATWARKWEGGPRVQASVSRQSAAWASPVSTGPVTAAGRENDTAPGVRPRSRLQKTEQTLQVSQSLWGQASLGVSFWQRDFWYRDDLERGVSSQLSTRYGNVGLSAGGSWTQLNGRENYALSASVSVPFDIGGRRYSAGTTVSSARGGNQNLTTGVSGAVTERLNMGVSTSIPRRGDQQSSLDADWSGDLVRARGMLTRDRQQTWTAGQMSGSVLAVPAAGSVVLSSNTHDTVVVAGVPGVKGVRFMGGQGVTDSRGNMVIPVAGYLTNTLSVDAATLPANVELGTTSHTFTPAAQAVLYMPFEVLEVNRYLLQVRRKDGTFVKAGTWAKSEKGTPLGFVARDGVLLINYVDKPAALHLDGCRIPTGKLTDSENLQEVMCDET